MHIHLTNTKKYKIGNRYTCTECGKKFIIMRTFTGSVLPVEWHEGMEYNKETIFDSSIHVSHLLNCTNKRRESWEGIKKAMRYAWLDKKKSKVGI